jgi:hypothetical protein
MPHVLYYFHDDLEESHPNAFEVSLELGRAAERMEARQRDGIRDGER